MKGIEDLAGVEEKEGNRLEWIEEHFEEHLVIKIIDAVTTIIITFMVVKLFEPYLKSSSLAAQAAIQAMIKRV